MWHFNHPDFTDERLTKCGWPNDDCLALLAPGLTTTEATLNLNGGERKSGQKLTKPLFIHLAAQVFCSFRALSSFIVRLEKCKTWQCQDYMPKEGSRV